MTETVVAAIRMKAVTRPKIATPSGRKQSEDPEFGPTCLPAGHDDRQSRFEWMAEWGGRKRGI